MLKCQKNYGRSKKDVLANLDIDLLEACLRRVLDLEAREKMKKKNLLLSRES